MMMTSASAATKSPRVATGRARMNIATMKIAIAVVNVIETISAAIIVAVAVVVVGRETERGRERLQWDETDVENVVVVVVMRELLCIDCGPIIIISWRPWRKRRRPSV